MSSNPHLDTEAVSQGTHATPERAIDIQQLVARLRVDAITGEPRPFPSLNTADDLIAWAGGLQSVFKAAKIPKDIWPEAALLFLQDSGRELQLKILLEHHRIQLTANGNSDAWDWSKYLETTKEFLVSFEEPGWIQQFQAEHQDSIRLAAKALIGIGAVALTPAAGIAVLHALGFTAAGVAGGSIAAGMQSALYGGLTTGIFSAVQSIGASVAVPAVASLGAAFGAVFAGVGVLQTQTGGKSGSDDEGANGRTRDETAKCQQKSSSSTARECTCEEK